ncbi:MAG: Calx-beta domain-containing protein [Fuerstiella sp.]
MQKTLKSFFASRARSRSRRTRRGSFGRAGHISRATSTPEVLENRTLLAAQLVSSDMTTRTVTPGETIQVPVLYQTLDDTNTPAALQANLLSSNLHFDADALTFVETTTTSIFLEGIQVVPNATRLESDATVTGDDGDADTETVLVSSYSDSDFALFLGWPNTASASPLQLYVATFTVNAGFSGSTNINFSANATGNVIGQSAQFEFQSQSLTLQTATLPSVSISDAPSVVEGGSSVFTVTLSEASASTVTVTYSTASGGGANGATSGTDFTAQTNQTLTFNPGETTKTITVQTTDDTSDEPDETFNVNLLNATNATIADGQGIGTILDDDEPALPTLSIADAPSVTEGNTATFIVSLSADPSSAVTVSFATSDGTGASGAASGTDYTQASGTLTFNSGGPLTQQVTVSTIDDSTVETTETFHVDLSNATNATIADDRGLGTILDNDFPVVSISDAPAVTEGGDAVFTVSLDRVSTTTVSVSYSSSDDSATAGSDYSAASGSLTFNPGETQKTITVATIDDSADELTETFHVDLTSATNATIGNSSGLGTINDNDVPTLSISDAQAVVEGNDAVFTVTISTSPAAAVTVTYAAADGSGADGATVGSDFDQTTGSLTFTPGGPLTQQVTVSTINDGDEELTESFVVDLSQAVGATILVGQGTGTILDNDGENAFGMIHGRKWNDLNGDGQRTSNEPWLNGWTIQLVDANGNVVDTQVTADNDINNDNQIDPETESGWYWFNALPGTYTLQEVVQAGWQQTAPGNRLAEVAFQLDSEKEFRATANNFQNWGGRGEKWFLGNDGWYFITPDGALFDWDGSPRTNLTGDLVDTFSPAYHADIALLHSAAVVEVTQYTVVAGETLTDVNFGNQNIVESGSIHGRKWNDLNGDGQRTSDEPWLNGWTIELVNADGVVVQTTVTMNHDLNSDGVIDPETESGWYWLTDVTPGEWIVREQSQAGWNQTSASDPVAVEAYNLDTELNLRFSRSLFPNWGGLNERWMLGDNDNWYYITPNGDLFRWNGSPRSALSGDLVATLSPAYHEVPSRLFEARNPYEVRVLVGPGEIVNDVNFGNQQDEGPPEVDFQGSGNVTVRRSGNDLILSGDQAGNGVIVFVDATGRLTVGGLGDTTIGGQDQPYIVEGWSGVPGSLVADLAGGNDGIVLQDIQIGGNLTINTDGGNDTVLLDEVDVAGNLDVRSSSGNNSIFANDTQVGGQALVNLGGGNDALWTNELSVGGSTTVRTGAGIDVFGIVDSEFQRDVLLATDGGVDWGVLVGANRFGANVTADGGAKFDAISVDAATQARGRVSIRSFENTVPDVDALLEEIMQDLADVGLDGLLK